MRPCIHPSINSSSKFRRKFCFVGEKTNVFISFQQPSAAATTTTTATTTE